MYDLQFDFIFEWIDRNLILHTFVFHGLFVSRTSSRSKFDPNFSRKTCLFGAVGNPDFFDLMYSLKAIK